MQNVYRRMLLFAQAKIREEKFLDVFFFEFSKVEVRSYGGSSATKPGYPSYEIQDCLSSGYLNQGTIAIYFRIARRQGT